MAHLSRYDVEITTDTGGFTGYTSVANGLINAIQIDEGTLSSTADVVITTENTSMPIISSVTVADLSTAGPMIPHYVPVDETGSAITNAHAEIGVSSERMKIVVSASSSTGQTGTLHVHVQGA
jgi:hypothetical protein